MFNKDRLDPEVVNDTPGTILKYREDIAEIQKKLPGLRSFKVIEFPFFIIL